MKHNILKLTWVVLCLFSVGALKAQTPADSTKAELIELPYGKLTEERVVGSVDVITAEDLMHYGGAYVGSAMEGQAVGYTWGRIRGYARGGNADAPLVIIDGLSNRNLGSITLEEVESIHILKDVTAKMLYGSRAANGVIMVKTKRGVQQKAKLSFTAEYGMQDAEFIPEYFGAVEYMKMRNQALTNDGIDPVFTDEQIENSGTSYKYPDVDYYDYFAKTSTSFQTFNAQLVGGDDKTQYFLNIGYVNGNGMEKVGDVSHTDAINVRSNLDYKVNDIVSVNLDIAARMFMSEGNHVGGGMWSKMSSSKPTDYSIFISDTPHIDSLGTKTGYNLYGAMVYSGYRKARTTLAQTNFGLNFDLNKYVKGLTGRAYAMFDMNNDVTIGKTLSYRTLKPDEIDGRDTLIINGTTQEKGAEARLSDGYYRNFGGGAYIDYNRTVGNHAVNATLNYMLDTKSIKISNAGDQNQVQDDNTMNFGGRLNYAYKNKYVAELSGNYMASNRFYVDNRWKMFGAAGASWIISEEDFMQDNGVFDYLKVKASYGSIGYDQSFSQLLYQDFYSGSGYMNTGVKNSEKRYGYQFSQTGNRDLTFEVSTEMNVGVDARLLNNHLAVSAEYFVENRTGMPTMMSYNVPYMAGVPTYIDNYNEIENTGYEVTLQYTNNVSDFHYSFGGTITGYESVYTKYHELNDFSFRNREGTATDARWGYVADGFYTSADDIANYGVDSNGTPLTSSLGAVVPGDLRFKDLSDGQSEYALDDNVINYYDTEVIGNSRPRYFYTLNVNLRYKNLSFYAMGQGCGGYDFYTGYNTYFTNKGDVNYSKHAYEAAIPTFDDAGNAVGIANPDFTRPRLTTQGSSHSYSTSTFFQEKGGYFRLSTVDLNYKLPESISKSIGASSLNVYVRGNNLMTISDLEDLNPANMYAGITGSPMMRTFLFGVKLGF